MRRRLILIISLLLATAALPAITLTPAAQQTAYAVPKVAAASVWSVS
jgi:hypothetical protein